MKLRKLKKQIPKGFRREMYESYKRNMNFHNLEITPYKEWLIRVFNTKI